MITRFLDFLLHVLDWPAYPKNGCENGAQSPPIMTSSEFVTWINNAGKP